MNWLKRLIRDWLQVEMSSYFKTVGEVKMGQIEFWESGDFLTAAEAERLRAEIRNSDKSKLLWKDHPSLEI